MITEGTLRLRPRPEARRYEGWSFRTLRRGRGGVRADGAGGALADVARLSDEDETRLTMALAVNRQRRPSALGRAYLRLRGHEGGCLVIVGWEGEAWTR